MRTTVLHRANCKTTAALTSSATSIAVMGVANSSLALAMPTVPILCVINPTDASPELILVTAVTTNDYSSVESKVKATLTIVRGAMGTTAKAHKVDSVIYEVGQKQVIRGFITLLGTAETVYLPMPKCFLVRVAGCLQGALSTANATVTVSKNATSLGTITVAYSGSAVGDWDELTADGDAIADFYFDGVDDYLKVATDGGGDNGKWEFMAEIIPY